MPLHRRALAQTNKHLLIAHFFLADSVFVEAKVLGGDPLMIKRMLNRCLA